MEFREFGDRGRPTVILLLREDSLRRPPEDLVRGLKADRHVVLPVIGGYGEGRSAEFVSIRDSARALIRYVDGSCRGKVFAVGGTGLGAQIAVETLAQRPGIAEYAVLESVPVCPAGRFSRFFAAACGAGHWLAGTAWKFLGRRGGDRPERSCKSWVRMIKAGRNYTLPETIGNTKAKVLIIVGTKELRRMDRSVRTLLRAVPGARACVSPGTRRGGFTLSHSAECLALVRHFMEQA